MKVVITLFCLLFSHYLIAQTSLEQIRINYTLAVTDKDKCKAMIEELKEKSKNPLYLGYLGGFQSIWANHVINPFAKIKTFNIGKENVEKAIEQDLDNMELRYIRLSIQKNAPAILGYRSKITQDTDLLKKQHETIPSAVVRQNIEKLLNDN